jgi:hypothetical protein
LSLTVRRQSAALPYDPFLPEIGTPVNLHGARGYVNAGDDELLSPARWSQYSFATEVDGGPSPRQTGKLITSPDHSLPTGMPKALITLVLGLSEGTTDHTAGHILALIEQEVKSIKYNAGATPGQSYYSLAHMVTTRIGTVAQHAALFAVLARAFGIPARVAVGYRFGSALVPGHAVEVRGQEAYAWAEVPYAGHGWVSFDPTIAHNTGKPPPPPRQGAPPPGSRSANAAQSAGPNRLPGGGGSSSSEFWWILLLVLAVIVLLALASVVAKELRRRRRRLRGSWDMRVLGAWRDAVDTLRETGTGVARTLTVSEVGALVDRTRGAECSGWLRLLDPRLAVALFAPSPATEADAAEAWRAADGLRRTCRRQLRWPRRLVAIVDPGTLFAWSPAGAFARRSAPARHAMST